MHIGLGIGLTAYSGSPYDPDATALFARFTTPATDARKALINDTIIALKAAGIWQLLDQFYLCDAHSSQAARQNWIGDVYNLTAVGAPVFTTDRGFQGDGSSAYLTSAIDYSAGNTLGSRNDFHISAWAALGGYVSGTSTLAVVGGSSSVGITSSTTMIRQAMGNNSSPIVTTSIDVMLANDRPNSTQQTAWADGVSAGTQVDASVAPTNAQFRLLRSAASIFSQQQIRGASSGRSLGALQTTFKSIVKTYHQAVGAVA